MDFVKMHGAGNDFIVVDLTENDDLQKVLADPSTASGLCDRHFGIGADGIIMVLPSERADLRMRIINSDGSEPEMCGNGIRCFALYAREHGLVQSEGMLVETLAGIIVPRIVPSTGGEAMVAVDMGEPRLRRADIPMTGPPEEEARGFVLQSGRSTYTATAVSMGNPHCVIFTDDVQSIDLSEVGPSIELSPLFPQKTNVEFVRVLAADRLQMRVWERGAGETLACGTGACASLVAGCINGLCDREASVMLPGGVLQISWSDEGRVIMTGPARVVYEGNLKPA